MNPDSRGLRGTGAVILITGIIVVILTIINYQATEQLPLLLVLGSITLPITGLYMLVTGRAPFGRG